MPKSAAKRTGTAAPAPRSWLWLQGALCGGLVVLQPGTALLLATLMGLGLAALMMEKEIGRPTIRAMLMMGGASTLVPLRHLWDFGGTLDAALDVLSNPVVPLLSWATTCVAWLVNEVWFVTGKHIMLVADEHSAKKLKAEREKLIEEWRDVA